MTLAYLARDIASRMHCRGAFICPEHADVLADLREIAGLDLNSLKEMFDARKIEILAAYGLDDTQPQNKPFAYSDGVAVIPIHGMLVNRLSWGSSYVTGYNWISSQLQAAVDDPDVKGIIFDVNSPGGIAAGCGECANNIFESRSEKPSLAVVDSRAYSAAYYLGSAASKMVSTPSGGVGSIGVVAMHVDLSGALEQDGIKVSFIQAGAEKIDGNPFQKLSVRARASIQRDVDYNYGMFTDAVAKFRDMPSEDVRNTEAACYLPPEALDLGLIDGIESPIEAVDNFVDEMASGAFDMVGLAAGGGSWKCGASRSLGVKESGSWDGPAASERMLAAAGFNGDSPNVTEARAGFLAYDAGDPKKKGSYKLPFADIVDGKKTAMRSGLNAAASRLSQTDIPQAVKDEAQAVIDHYKPKDDKKAEGGDSAGAIDMDETQVKAMVSSAVAEALAANRQRRADIVTSEEAKNRQKLAAHLADNTDMSVDAAKAVLSASAEEKPDTPAPKNAGGNPFDAVMGLTKNPNLSPDGNGDTNAAADTPEKRAGGLLGAYERMTGAKVIDVTPKRDAA